MDRKSNVSRTTSETDIKIKMDLDGKGKYDILPKISTDFS